MNTQTLVVGATGTVGSELVKQLAATGRRVRALVRNEVKARSLPSIAEPVIGDLSAPHTLGAVFDGVERAFILAPPLAELEQLVGAAFDAAAAAGVRRIVYLSAFGAGELDGPHWRAHGRSEERLMALGPAWTILRPTRFATSTPFLWQPVFEHGLVLEGSGDETFTTVDPRDVAAVAVRALGESGHEGRTYELTAGEALSAAGLSRLLAHAFGRSVRPFEGDDRALRVALIAGGAPPEYADIMVTYARTVREGRWHPNATAEGLLGRPPRSYAQWLGEHRDRLSPHS
jgi:uncharacterized protein YbjT (DUF2867 family)